jgi:hypothetical protein
MNTNRIRSKWAAVGAAVAVSLGAGGIGITHATTSSGEKPIYKPIEPCRLADLRPAPFTVGARTAPLGPDEEYTLSGWGAVGDCALPNDTTGLALNVTAVDASQGTFLTFFPADATRPNASNLNPSPGQPPTPNAVNVDLDAAGEFKVFNRFGNVNVIIDVVGLYDDHNHDDRYYTEDEVDTMLGELPDTMWATVSAGNPGAITRQSGGVTLQHGGTGNSYFLTFPRDVTDCAWNATLGGSTILDNVLAVLNHLGIAASQGNNGLAVDPDEVNVTVFEQDSGNVVVSAFNLVVTCPQ